MKGNPQIHSAHTTAAHCVLNIFDVMGCGCLLLDDKKRLMDCNAEARRHFGSGLAANHGRLCASDPVTEGPLQAMLDSLLRPRPGDEPAREAMGVRRGDRQPLIMRVVAVEENAREHLGGAALVVVVIDPEECPTPSFAALQQVFGFTRSEARVATGLMCGLTLEEIARDAQISLGTVRSQVKAAFAKTQTHRQAELVALLTRLAIISRHG